MGVKDVLCKFRWKIAVYGTVVFSERVDRSLHGGYNVFIACKIMNICFLGLPYQLVDTVPLLFLFYELFFSFLFFFFFLLPKFVP